MALIQTGTFPRRTAPSAPVFIASGAEHPKSRDRSDYLGGQLIESVRAAIRQIAWLSRKLTVLFITEHAADAIKV